MFRPSYHLINASFNVILSSNHPVYCKCNVAVLVAYEKRREKKQTVRKISPEPSTSRERIKGETTKEDRPTLSQCLSVCISHNRILHHIAPGRSCLSKAQVATRLDGQFSTNTN